MTQMKTLIVSVGLIGGLLIATVLALRSEARDAESAGPYNVGGSVVRIDTEQKGPCQPGAIESGYNVSASTIINGANPVLLRFTAPVNDNPGFRGCIAPRNGPQYLVINNELFQYANIHTQTSATMFVDNSTQSFNLYVDDCYGYSPSDLIYVGMERMQWDTGFCDGAGGAQDYLHITARPDSTDTAHGPRSFVRVHGLLYLVARSGLPKFLDWSSTSPIGIKVPPTTDPIAYTAVASHSAGSPAHSPSTYARCRDLLTQTSQAGDDGLSARTRCSLIYEPGYDAAGCDSTPDSCYWPTSPLNATTLRRPVFPLQPSWNLTSTQLPPQYDSLGGFIDDDGSGYIGFLDVPISATGNCLLYFSLSPTEHIYINSDMQIPTGAKNFTPGATGTGTLYVRYFVTGVGSTNPCSGNAAITISSPFTFERLSATHDTDGDGCQDSKELTGTRDGGNPPPNGLRGARDPLNRFDYFNPTGDRLNRVDDILAVVGQYFQDDPPNTPDLMSVTDRTALMPGEWNLGKPNGLQRVDDILAIVKQYFHDCTVTTPWP